jgi:hypothetical protein
MKLEELEALNVVDCGIQGVSDAAVSSAATSALTAQARSAAPASSVTSVQASGGDAGGTVEPPAPPAPAPVVQLGDQQGRLPNTLENQRADVRARALLTSAIDTQLLHLTRRHATSKGLWDAITQRFSEASIPIQQQLERDMLDLKKFKHETMLEYISRAETLRDRMFAAGVTNSDASFVYSVIRGVDQAQYRTEVTLLESDPMGASLHRVQQVLTAGERRLNRDQSIVPLTQAHAHAVGHTATRGKVRFQPQFQHRPGQRGPCYGCGEMGHLKAQCPMLQQQRQQPGRQLQVVRGPKKGPGKAYAAFAFTATSGQKGQGAKMAQGMAERWLLDSGSSSHICNQIAFFRRLKFFKDKDNCREEQSVKLADGSEVEALGIGTAVITAMVDGVLKQWELVDCLFVPALSTNLISTVQLGADYNSPIAMMQKGERCDLIVGGEKFATAVIATGVPMLDSYTVAEGARMSAVHVSAFAVSKSAMRETVQPTNAQHLHAKLMHRRFGHLGMSNMAKLPGIVEGMNTPAAAFIPDPLCEPCIKAKMVRAPFPSSGSASSSTLQMLHMDLCGPLQVPTHGGARYVATFLDDYTKVSAVRLLHHKDELSATLQEIALLFENQAGKALKTIRSDRGGEFVNWQVEEWLHSKGILHDKTVPYSPQQNGAAERLNRTLMERVRAMLSDAGLPPEFWGEAMYTASYLRNRSPAAGISKTPYEMFTGRKPDVSHLRVFGSKVWAKRPDQLRKKLDPKAVEGRFVGYEQGTKGYRVWVADAPRRITISRDVVFDEGVQPAVIAAKPAAEKTAVPVQQLHDVVMTGKLDPAAVPADDSDAVNNNLAAEPLPVLQIQEPSSDECNQPLQESSFGPGSGTDGDSDQQSLSDAGSDAGSDGVDRGGSGNDDGAAADQDAAGPRQSARPNKGVPPKPLYTPDDPKAKAKAAVNAVQAASRLTEPATYEEAMAGPNAAEWYLAMVEEMQSLHANGTYSLQELPPGHKAIRNKWVYKLKYDAAGRVERFRARLVAKGFEQVEGVDFNEVFAPTSKQTSLRVLLSIVADRDLELGQLDVKTAFLNGVLEEELYMEQPVGFHEGEPRVVCRMHKALYGLRQAPKAWYDKLKGELEKLGFTSSDADPGLWVGKSSAGSAVFMLVWVDDVLIASDTKECVDEAKQKLMGVFDARDLGEATVFIGMQISRDREQGVLKLSQHNHITQMLAKHRMLESRPAPTPMDPGIQLDREHAGPALDTAKYPYSSIVGGLLYVSVCTRPDISQAVGVLSRYMSAPQQMHWNAAMRVLRYLAGTADLALVYKASGCRLEAFCDADYAGDVDSRKSTGGFAFMLNEGAVSWASKLQPTVAVSTTEAEYMAAAAAAKEALWFSKLLATFGLTVSPISIWCDSQSAMHLIKNAVVSQRSKHIDVQHHFLKERVARGEVLFKYCSTTANVADCLTKALPSVKFADFRGGLGLNKA